LAQLCEWALERRIEHLHFRIPCAAYELVRAAQSAGFYLVSSNVHFTRAVQQSSLTGSTCAITVRAGRWDDVEELRAISGEAFCQGTRFHLDPSLSVDRATYLHQLWIENCLKGQVADIVLVAQVGGRLAGYITFQRQRTLEETLDLRVGDIGLFAVSAAFERQGIGQELLVAGLSWCYEKGLNTVTVSTEATNVAAINSYIKGQFRVYHTTYSLSWVPRRYKT